MTTAEKLHWYKGKKCIVTGGAGFIGSHLTDALLSLDASEVVVIDNLLTGSIQNLKHLNNHDSFRFIQADLNDTNSVEQFFTNADVVFHQAALGSVPRSVENPPATDLHNVHAFVNMLHMCKQNQVKRVVFASSSSVYGDNTTMPKQEDRLGNPLSPYAVSKRSDELYAQVFASLYPMQISGLRYFNVFGPRQNPNGPYAAVIPLFINSLLDHQPVKIFGDGEQSRDFTFVANVVQANLLAAVSDNTSSFQVMNIGCGGSYSVNRLFETLKVITNSQSEAIHAPERNGDIRNSSASVERAAQLIGYFPAYSLEQGLEETVRWFKANRHVFN